MTPAPPLLPSTESVTVCETGAVCTDGLPPLPPGAGAALFDEACAVWEEDEVWEEEETAAGETDADTEAAEAAAGEDRVGADEDTAA